LTNPIHLSFNFKSIDAIGLGDQTDFT